MKDVSIELFMAIILTVSIAVYLRAGKIRLYMAPEPWKEVSRADDPGRYWTFIVGLSVVLGVLVVKLILQWING